MSSNSLTTKEVAKLCRVSDATVKRWELSGLIASERTDGGHRRFRAEDIAQFQKSKKLGVKRQSGDDTAIKAFTRKRLDKSLSDCTFFQSLVSGCEDEASARLIKDYMDGASLNTIIDGLICRSLHRVGVLWFQGKLTVPQEHLATRTVLSAIYRLRSMLPVVDSCGKLAVCFSFEGDFHEVPSHLVQITLENEGWEVLNFGANTPLFCVTDEILQHRPAVVCMSSTTLTDVERISQDYNEFVNKISGIPTKILLGGRTFADGELHSRFKAHHYPKTFTELAEVSRKLASEV